MVKPHTRASISRLAVVAESVSVMLKPDGRVGVCLSVFGLHCQKVSTDINNMSAVRYEFSFIGKMIKIYSKIFNLFVIGNILFIACWIVCRYFVGVGRIKKQTALCAVCLVGLPGFEPGTTGPESVMLPLHHSPVFLSKAEQR